VRFIAATIADLETTPLGTRSRLADMLDIAHAEPPSRGRDADNILRRTVARAAAIDGIASVLVACPRAQARPCAALLADAPARVVPMDLPPPPWTELVRIARKWALDSWRGGIAGSTCFDEYADMGALCALLDVETADGVLVFPPAAPLLDVRLGARMLAHRSAAAHEMRVVFTQAPPGVAGLLLDASLIRELAEKRIPPGWAFSYKPDAARKDLIFEDCCVDVPAALRHATGRLIADTDRSIERVRAVLARDADPDAETLGRALQAWESSFLPDVPRELEIELTTDDPYPETLLRPRGERVPRRGPIEPSLVGQAVRELCRYDDALVVLGGFGDPLLHPRFADVLAAIRSAAPADRPLLGLAVRTPCVELNDDVIDALITHRVDIVEVLLDAWTPSRYAALQTPAAGADASRYGHATTGGEAGRYTLPADLGRVLANIERITARTRSANTAAPVILPSMTKARHNVEELDEFFDGWVRRVGAVCVTAYSHHAGQVEDRSVIDMTPSTRCPCRRLQSRAMLLADGTLVACDQDFRARQAMGYVGGASPQPAPQAAARASDPCLHRLETGATQSPRDALLSAVWRGVSFTALRAAHKAADRMADRTTTGAPAAGDIGGAPAGDIAAGAPGAGDIGGAPAGDLAASAPGDIGGARYGRFAAFPLCATCAEWHRP
jgi:hypothetical protein